MHSPRVASTAPRTAVASLFALTLSVLPAFMLGGVAVLVRDDLGFSESRLGLAISTFYATCALASVAGGRLVERLGGLTSLRVGVGISTLSLLGIAAFTGSWLHLIIWLGVGGVANAILQPATNLAIARVIPLGRQGLALGFKQTNGPFGTLLAGLSAPLIGVVFGWRWSFATAALLAVVFFAVCPPNTDATAPVARRPGDRTISHRSLVLLAAGAGCGVGAAMALVGFYMESAVTLGHSIAFAGTCLAIGSGAGAAARVSWGWVADRMATTGVTLVAGMLFVGSLSFLALAFSGRPWVLLVVTVLVFVTGWGWVGLMHFVTIRLSPRAPAYASGVVNTGVSLGGIGGPFTFGLVVERAGYTLAWSATSALMVLAGVLILAGGRAARYGVEAASA